MSTTKGSQAEAYTPPNALQSLLRAFGFAVASELAAQSLQALEKAVEVLHSHLQSKLERLSSLRSQLQVSLWLGPVGIPSIMLDPAFLLHLCIVPETSLAGLARQDWAQETGCRERPRTYL